MTSTIYLFIYFVAMSTTDICCKSINLEERSVVSGKIIGGTETTSDAYSYTAFLRIHSGRTALQCGGSIITEHHILTAGHCLYGGEYVIARIGTFYRDTGKLKYNTTEFVIHPEYDHIKSKYNAGIIIIQKGMEFEDPDAPAYPIDLVPGYYDPIPGEMLIITGWGIEENYLRPNEELIVATVPVMDRTTCGKLYGGVLENDMFCAGYEWGGVDTCDGDDGGPAVSRFSGALTGIATYGFGCGEPNAPGIYVRVGHYAIKKFIERVTGL